MDPIKEFETLFKKIVLAKKEILPEACVLATASRSGRPSARYVLLKAVEDSGFQFFTNYDSPKSIQLKENPFASLVFRWPSEDIQVRVDGSVSVLSRDVSEKYFATRPRESQIGAWASPQSEALLHRDELEKNYLKFEGKFKERDVPCPQNWGGFTLKPDQIEFWKQGPHRLHFRQQFTLGSAGWKMIWLNP